MSGFMCRWGLAIKVLGFSMIVLMIRLAAHGLGLEFITPNMLLSSVIGGMTFLIGFILAGTLADYKESEKLPTEILSSLEAIYEEGKYLKDLDDKFSLDRLAGKLGRILDDIHLDLVKSKRKMAIRAVSSLSESFLEAERLGLPIAYVSRMKAEQSQLKKNILRVYYIKQTQFIPAAYAIVDIMVLIIMFILVFLRIDPFIDSLFMVAIISYIFIYMTMLIKDIDDPFNLSKRSYADINMQVLFSFRGRLKRP